jgi:hypothetical protein
VLAVLMIYFLYFHESGDFSFLLALKVHFISRGKDNTSILEELIVSFLFFLTTSHVSVYRLSLFVNILFIHCQNCLLSVHVTSHTNSENVVFYTSFPSCSFLHVFAKINHDSRMNSVRCNNKHSVPCLA